MRKTIAAATAAGAMTAAALLTPAVGAADPIGAICDTYRAEAQGLIIRATARPITTRMLIAADISPSWEHAFGVIDSTVTANCPEFIPLL